MNNFTCHTCKKTKPMQKNGGTGYGVDNGNNKICYACCGKQDLEQMETRGKATLYLGVGRVTNWPDTLSFIVQGSKKGKHNIAGVRYDVWFYDANGREWHGVTYGDNTQICHCRRLKSTKNHWFV